VTITTTDTVTPTPTNEPIPDLIFGSDYFGNFQICRLSGNGTIITNLSQNAYGDSHPDVSPDGSKILFLSNRNGNQDIYMMDIDGTNQVMLNDDPSYDYDPDWSPDGNRVIFSTNRFDGFTRLAIMNADGTNITRLIDPPDSRFGLEVSPDWSPDGNTIVFEGVGVDFQLCTISIDGSGLITIGSVDGISAKWSPDGTRLAVHARYDVGHAGQGNIFTMAPDGSSLVQLTDDDNSNQQPVWSRDGSKIAFYRNGLIYIMNADGTNTRCVMCTGINSNPTWP
jgi:TolB protein